MHGATIKILSDVLHICRLQWSWFVFYAINIRIKCYKRLSYWPPRE